MRNSEGLKLGSIGKIPYFRGSQINTSHLSLRVRECFGVTVESQRSQIVLACTLAYQLC